MLSEKRIKFNDLSLGAKVAIITNAQFRYEGSVAVINSIDGTLTLKCVRFCGTERISNGTDHPTTTDTNKVPAVGTMFDSITFWMSNIVQMWSFEELKNYLNDKAVVKAAISTDNKDDHNQIRSKNDWTSNKVQRKTDKFNSVYRTVVYERNPRSLANNSIRPVPRKQYISYEGFTPYINQHETQRPFRNRTNQGQVMHFQNPPIQPYQKFRDRKHVQFSKYPYGATHYQPNSQSYRRYIPNDVFQSSPSYIRPNKFQTKFYKFNKPRINSIPPYDFEKANAELELEMAKINLDYHENNDDSSSRQRTQSPHVFNNDKDETNENRIQVSSTSTNGGKEIMIHSTTQESQVSSASGDNLSGVRSSDAGDTVKGGTDDTISSTSLSKGEFYVRDKSFYDQISGSYSNNINGNSSNRGISTEARSDANSNKHNNGSVATSRFLKNTNRTTGTTNPNSKERKLNMETFGPIALKPTSFVKQRLGHHPNSTSMRESLVFAPA